ncbi:MAG TPA: protealysin inhibitor emfourin [Mycobacteriales bacterium]
MHITVTRSGGLAGLRLERSVDTAGRPDAAEFEELVRSARLGAVGPAKTGQPDRYSYRVDVDGHTVTLGEDDLSGPLHTLVERVLAEPAERR